MVLRLEYIKFIHFFFLISYWHCWPHVPLPIQLFNFTSYKEKCIETWEARTRHRRCYTRVRRGRTRRRAGDAAARASSRVGPRGSHVVFTDARRREPIRLRRAPTRADSGRLGPESAGIGRNRQESAGIGRYRPKRPKQPISAEIQKKRKKKNPESTEIQSCELCLIYENHVFSYYLLLLLNLVYVCIMWKNMLSNI